MKPLYQSAEEEARHLHAIRAIAAETGNGFEAIREIYEEELTLLAQDARMRDFLLVLTLRHTRQLLRRRVLKRQPESATA